MHLHFTKHFENFCYIELQDSMHPMKESLQLFQQ